MRFSLVNSFIFFVCLCIFQESFATDKKAANKKGEPQGFAKNGQFMTKHNHDCNWEIISEEQFVILSLSCNEQGNSSYKCTFRGEPNKCPLYRTKAKQYWKQIFAKFKKMTNVCDEKTLKSRICKKSAAFESQLVKMGGEVVEDVERGKIKGKGRVKGSEKEQEEKQRMSEVNKNVGTEIKSNAKKRKPGIQSSMQPDASMPPSQEVSPTARVVNDDIVELNEDIAGVYCTEKWHSVCSFFVNFWNG
ncbi:fibroblast growth factor-binding protein 3 [Bombina bombina]|uniref:fibroblast growth factor-binding protein 3 n=1 Tax=Bombina bombina TaxID=8345 RepID=UPI00235A978C|nr:fibroblast growth factor-binding protein 3 [Bombina bombina]